MIRNIVFGGCSYTWGQSLHLFDDSDVDPSSPGTHGFDENSVRSWDYQKIIDRRFATIVSNYFGRKSKVDVNNGGSTWSIHAHVLKAIDTLTDLVIIQTTNFTRNMTDGRNLSMETQVSMYKEILDYCNEKNIPIRFLHWDWPEDMIEIPSEIKNISMKFDGKYSFFDMTLKDEYIVDSKDRHFNFRTHKIIANRIIDNIEELGLLKQPKYD